MSDQSAPTKHISKATMDEPQEEFIDAMPNEVDSPPADIEHGDEIGLPVAIHPALESPEDGSKKSA